MSKHFDPNDYTDAEKRTLARVIEIGGRRTKRQITAQQALSRALRATIEPAIAALEGTALLLDLFVELELAATKTNASRLATHPLRPKGVDAAIARRLADEAEASKTEPGGTDQLQDSVWASGERCSTCSSTITR